MSETPFAGNPRHRTPEVVSRPALDVGVPSMTQVRWKKRALLLLLFLPRRPKNRQNMPFLGSFISDALSALHINAGKPAYRGLFSPVATGSVPVDGQGFPATGEFTHEALSACDRHPLQHHRSTASSFLFADEQPVGGMASVPRKTSPRHVRLRSAFAEGVGNVSWHIRESLLLYYWKYYFGLAQVSQSKKPLCVPAQGTSFAPLKELLF